MRLISILTAAVVIVALYFFVLQRDALFSLSGRDASEPTVASSEEDAPAAEPEDATQRISVVARRSLADQVDSAVILRGRTEAARQVDVRAETSGRVISEPLRRGAYVEAGELLCRIDPGTREVDLAEAKALLAEAQSRLPESEARLAEARAALPAAQALITEARARVPEAEARLSEAKAGLPAAQADLLQAEAGVPAAEAALVEARTRLPEAEARVIEADARFREAMINVNAASRLSEGGFASDTRVASAEAAREAARAQIQSANSQIEGARAGIQSAVSAVEGAKSEVETARSRIEGARASIASAESQVEGAEAGVISAESSLEGARASIQSAVSGVEAAKAGIQSAEAAVAAAERELERLEILAPFGGLLESDAAELGALLQPGSLCATVIQLNPLKLVGFVPETQVDRVTLGAAASARLASGREVLGRVSFLSRSADPNTRTFRVEVRVENSEETIRDGQTAEIIVASDGAEAHLLPQSALTLDNDGRLGVRVVAENKTAAFAPISVLRDSVEGIWVTGLGESADVIVVGQEYVTDGVPVEPTYQGAVE
ncbi:MAG: efflux RND transporter periplasmic adaptor subunit [Pseudomonadota bacterium]